MYRFVKVTYAPVSIIEQPKSTQIKEGDSAEFSVIAVGTLPLSYQWYKDGEKIHT